MSTTITTSMRMSTSPRTVTTVRRTSGPRMLLSARAHIDLHDKGLTAVAGAQEIIVAMQARKSVTKLILGHNSLGDEGCRELFRFLCAEDGRRFQIAEISLNMNAIGDAGLEAIAVYLVGNQYLRELFLQGNAIQGETHVAVKLAAAVNSSKLQLLSLASNQQLSDPFHVAFLSHIDSPTLRELQLSATGLSRNSAPTLIAYCTSQRSHALETLKCNGNRLGAGAVRLLLAALRTKNFTLQKLEVYANSDVHWQDGRGDEEEENANPGRDESVEEDRAKWATFDQDLKSMLIRNELLRTRVHEHALALLTYARALLLCLSRESSSPSQSSPIESLPKEKPVSQHKNSVTNGSFDISSPNSLVEVGLPTSTSTPPFPFRALPTELQHYILSFLAPTLSASQRARIFSFASDPGTLAPLLPSLRPTSPHACIPDPACLPFSSTPSCGPTSPGLPSSKSILGLSPKPDMGGFGMLDFGGMRPTASPCASGRCMGAGGSVLCHREQARIRWLAQVGCSRFDADRRTEKDVMDLIAGDS